MCRPLTYLADRLHPFTPSAPQDHWRHFKYAWVAQRLHAWPEAIWDKDTLKPFVQWRGACKGALLSRGLWGVTSAIVVFVLPLAEWTMQSSLVLYTLQNTTRNRRGEEHQGDHRGHPGLRLLQAPRGPQGTCLFRACARSLAAVWKGGVHMCLKHHIPPARHACTNYDD